jgi:hypothetical protein
LIRYCRLVHSATELDIMGAAQALREVGYATSQSEDNPERDVEFFSFLMRDTGARDEQRKGYEAFAQRRRDQRDDDRKRGRLKGR